MATRVIVDCDNTGGIPGYEIDDALALLYLAADPSVELIGITTTFGNGTIDQVMAQTAWLVELVGRADVPVIRGAAGRGDWDTPASRYIAEQCLADPRGVQIAALGPLGNVAGAIAHSNGVAAAIAGVHAMGGYTAPLRFPRRQVSELNLSADPAAAYAVLQCECEVRLMSAQLCLDLPFRREHFSAVASYPPWFRDMVARWYRRFSSAVGVDAFYLWDVLPVLSAASPEAVPRRIVRMESSREDLTAGTLRARRTTTAGISLRDPGIVDLPERLPEPETVQHSLFQRWREALDVKEKNQ